MAAFVKVTDKPASSQVLQVNERVLVQVSDRFTQLCGMLIPSLHIALTKTHACASQGLAVTVKRSVVGRGGPGRDRGEDASGWREVEKEAEDADMGVAVNEAEDNPSSAVSATAAAGLGSLEQLSGGQRSLVSLSLLLAAAQEGSHSSVLLLDEVDAALDENNQVRPSQRVHDQLNYQRLPTE